MLDADLVAGLPKAELHVHHVGSASPATVARLAARHAGTSPVPADPGLLAEYFTFTDFGHFIEVYLSVVDLIRDADDVHMLTTQVIADLAAQQVRYVELTVTPYTSIVRGIPAEEFCAAIEDARLSAESADGPVVRWCFDIPGEAGVPAADVTLDVALRLQPAGLVSFGLGGPEAGVPKSWFVPHFAAARAAGLRSVPHAGESAGPDSVVAALDLLGAERVGHGIAAARDPAVMERLVDEGVALEVCPTSNVCTRSVPGLAEHPLPTLVDAGVTVTVNSDDPPMFSTTLTREYLLAAELLDLDLSGVADLARTAARVSFAPDDVRRALLAEIDAYVRSAGDRPASG